MSFKKMILYSKDTHISIESMDGDTNRSYSTLLGKRVAPHALLEKVLASTKVKGDISRVTITYME
jgi:hypothetical protein